MKPRSIRCMKFFIALFNIIFILFGLVLMAICVINMRERKAQAEQSALSRGVLSFLLTVGLALVVTAILGCIGALRENIKILYVHACFLIFLVSVEVMVGVGGAVLSACVGGGSELRMQFYKNTTVEDDGTNVKTFWDNLQSEVIGIHYHHVKVSKLGPLRWAGHVNEMSAPRIHLSLLDGMPHGISFHDFSIKANQDGWEELNKTLDVKINERRKPGIGQKEEIFWTRPNPLATVVPLMMIIMLHIVFIQYVPTVLQYSESGGNTRLSITLLFDKYRKAEEIYSELKGTMVHKNSSLVSLGLGSNHCCGIDGPQDYAILDRDVPASCCARAHPLREGGARRHLHSTCLNNKSYYTRGCEEVLRQKKSLKGKIFITIGVLFILLEIICIILAIWMARSVRNERRKLQQNLQAHFES